MRRGIQPSGFRLPKFVVISGIGWSIDVFLMLYLVHLGVDVFLANMIGAGTAVTFVFVASQRVVFIARRQKMLRMFGMYLCWHAVAITLASLAIDWLAAVVGGCAGWAPEAAAPACGVVATPWIAAAIAKAVVTPVTLYSNYVFTSWAIEARASWT